MAIERKSCALRAAVNALLRAERPLELVLLGLLRVFHGLYLRVTAIRQKRFFQDWPFRVIVCNCLGAACCCFRLLLVPMIAQASKGENVYEDGGDDVRRRRVPLPRLPGGALLSAESARIYSAPDGRPVGIHSVYLGLVNVALLAWLVARRKRLDRGLIEFVLYGMAVFAVIASGDHFHVFGRPTIPLPDLLLSYVPFFKNVRGPARAMVLVYLFLSIGVGYAISTIWQDYGATWIARHDYGGRPADGARLLSPGPAEARPWPAWHIHCGTRS